jgi:hypothetical protein
MPKVTMPFEQWCDSIGLPGKTAPEFAAKLEQLSGVRVPSKPAFVGAEANRAQRRSFTRRFELWRRAVERALDALRLKHGGAAE